MIVKNSEFFLVIDGYRRRYAIERTDRGGSNVRCIEPKGDDMPQRYFDCVLDARDVKMVAEVMKRFV